MEKVMVKDFAYPNEQHYVDVVLFEYFVNIDAAAAELVSKPHDGPPACLQLALNHSSDM